MRIRTKPDGTRELRAEPHEKKAMRTTWAVCSEVASQLSLATFESDIAQDATEAAAHLEMLIEFLDGPIAPQKPADAPDAPATKDTK